MFRTFRARAGILSLSRLPLRVHSATRQNALPVERVRFLQPGSRSKTVIGSLFMYTALYAIFTTVVLSPLSKLDLDEETAKEVDEQGASIFIPFPGTIKQIPPQPYRGNDPEWQEYVKFSKNPALARKIRDELAIFIQQAVGKHPVLTMRCGKDIKLRRYWLDVDFPSVPPPEFERSGIEITDDYVGWTTMPVDSLTVFRIRQALWPSALTRSLFSFSKVLFWHDTPAIGGILGIPTKQQPPVDTNFSEAIKRASAQSGTPKQPDEESTSHATGSAHRALEEREELSRPDPSNVTGKASPERLQELKKEVEAARRKLDQVQKKINDIKHETQLSKAWRAFRKKFAQTWRPAPNYPPRGSILVSGLIELDSPRAWLVVDVKAAWDPKTKQYDARSMRLVMRRLQMKKQEPLGR